MKTDARFAGVRALIFDLDGTLIDSKLDLALSVNAMLSEMKRAALTHETIFGYVGNGAPTLVKRALGHGASDEEAEEGLKYFLAYYREHMLDNTVTYPGVRDGLEALAREKHSEAMAVLTNKPVVFSKAIIEGLGLARYFKFVYGGNSFERKKPDPMGVEILLRDLGAPARGAMMVGDSDVDVLTARRVGARAVGCLFGLAPHSLEAVQPDRLVEHASEWPEALGL